MIKDLKLVILNYVKRVKRKNQLLLCEAPKRGTVETFDSLLDVMTLTPSKCCIILQGVLPRFRWSAISSFGIKFYYTSCTTVVVGAMDVGEHQNLPHKPSIPRPSEVQDQLMKKMKI